MLYLIYTIIIIYLYIIECFNFKIDSKIITATAWCNTPRNNGTLRINSKNFVEGKGFDINNNKIEFIAKKNIYE